MKLVIEWLNGDKEKVEVTDEYARNFNPNEKFYGFKDWCLTTVKPIGALNLYYARKVYLQD